MQTSFLKPLLKVTPSSVAMATVCADVTHTTEAADTELELRVRGITERLADLGAPEAVRTAVAGRLLEGNDDSEAGRLRGRAVVADTSGNVLLDHALIDAPLREVVDYSTLPDLLPVLRQLPERVPHVVVLADRRGADLDVVGGPAVPEAGRPEPRAGTSVDGETQYVHKVHAGGWSELRWQHSSEEVWRRNAGRVADELTRRVRELNPRFVLMAGDERARRILLDELPEEVARLVVTTSSGGRAAGADRSGLAEREGELVAEQLAHDDAATAELIVEGLHHGDAVTGLDAVVEAMRKGQVRTLVLAQEGLDLQLRTGPDPLELGMRAEELAAMGVRDAELVPADRALLRAAVATDAEVVVLPLSALPGRIPVAALLRFTQTPAADLAAPEPSPR